MLYYRLAIQGFFYNGEGTTLPILPPHIKDRRQVPILAE